MGRMIDEGELVKVLEERATNEAICGYMTEYDVTNRIIYEVNEQTTAYDQEKVDQQLEDYGNEEMHYYKGTPYEKCIEVCIGKAIEIVKGGGVDGN